MSVAAIVFYEIEGGSISMELPFLNLLRAIAPSLMRALVNEQSRQDIVKRSLLERKILIISLKLISGRCFVFCNYKIQSSYLHRQYLEFLNYTCILYLQKRASTILDIFLVLFPSQKLKMHCTLQWLLTEDRVDR